MTFITVAGDGRVLNVYSPDSYPDLPSAYDGDKVIAEVRHPAIPADAIKLSDKDAQALSEAGPWRWNGTSIVPFITPVDLNKLRISLKNEIDAAAEIERLKYITPGSGQAMTYQQKIEEARAFSQELEPVPENYPLLSVEIGITAPTLAEVASRVLAAYQQWQIIGAAIERSRLEAKMAVDAASNPTEALNAAASVVWPGQ